MEWIRRIASNEVLKLWFKRSASLLWGALLYNVFVMFVVEPLLRRMFPPLTRWEQVRGLFTGQKRTTYVDVIDFVAPTLWILGNALLFALLNRNYREIRASSDQDEA